MIISLPFDIFYLVSCYGEDTVFLSVNDIGEKIASYLSPQDLLNMSRTVKSLRNMLMSKSYKSAWLVAEAAVGLPACPPDISCPQYASLVFDDFCTVNHRLCSIVSSLTGW